jgi:ATP-dependent helicase HrpB
LRSADEDILDKNAFMKSYPIDHILPQLSAAIRQNHSVVVQAPPGAGKTTRVPLSLLDTIAPEHGRILMLEPRRIAAVSAARWMAQTLGERVGETVGYAIRFDARKSDKTRVEVVTEGVLTRRLQADPGLEGTALVIFDEFHERSIHADLALALCLDVRKVLRPDLKILIMSATLDPGPIASLLGEAPVIVSPGEAFPVEERYLETGTGPLSRRIAAAIKTALKETEGDILVFLPGSGEIRSAVKDLHEELQSAERGISLHPLYGDLPFEEQERAIQPSKDKRKIVLATNIAETSLTIEGVQVVIDSGLTRMLRYDPSSGMNKLVTASVSRASAEQRKGRAGRLAPGVCYRLYTRHDFLGMAPFTQPEILVSELSQPALELAAWGVSDPRDLTWIDEPPHPAWESGRQLLRDLGALDPSGKVTPTGKAMARLPLHPRLSRLMLKAAELDCIRLGADLAALLTERDIFRHSPAARSYEGLDISERIDALHRWQEDRESGGTVDPSALRAVERTATQLMRMMSDARSSSPEQSEEHDMISRLLLSSFPDRICKRREDGGGRFVHASGRGVRISPESRMVSSPYLIALAVDAGDKAEGFVHIAAPISEALIRSDRGEYIAINRKLEWDRKEGRINAAIEERLETLLLSRQPFTPTDDEAAPILCDVIRTTPGTLTLGKEAKQFQARVKLMHRAFPEEAWPDLSNETLLRKPEEWLLPWLGGLRSAQGLAALHVLPALKAMLSREQLRSLEERAPLSIPVPSGGRAVLDYTDGELPVLAVKLQEMFGLADTPTIAGGRVKVLLHLLSPARRPVQITQDLKGFWNNAYQQVKKDLKGRYPKHPWPDDPWNAVPTRRTNPRGRPSGR